MTEDEVYVGAKLYCDRSGDVWTDHYVVGNIYEISYVNKSGVLGVNSELGRRYFHGRLPPSGCPSFIPLDRLTEEERFLFDMSGKFPERLL